MYTDLSSIRSPPCIVSFSPSSIAWLVSPQSYDVRRLHLFSDFSKDQRRSDDFMENRVKISIGRITFWPLRPSLYNREFEKREIFVGHLHDDGFLLLRPEFILFFLPNLNLIIPVMF